MREQETKSLLLVEADPAERRLVSAVAARAGWITVGADCIETAVGLLQGPHGREVQAALIANWDEASGPETIAALREGRPGLPVIVVAKSESVTDAVNAMRSGATDFLSSPVAPERLVEALAANGDRRKPAGELIPVSEKMTPDLSLEQLVGSLAHGIENVRDTRLLPFVGRQGEKPKPKSALFWRSGLTVPAIRANFEGMLDFLKASQITQATADDNLWVDSSTRFEFDNALRAAEVVTTPVDIALADPKQRKALDYLIILTGSLQTLLGENLAAALGLSVGFSSLDGD